VVGLLAQSWWAYPGLTELWNHILPLPLPWPSRPAPLVESHFIFVRFMGGLADHVLTLILWIGLLRLGHFLIGKKGGRFSEPTDIATDSQIVARFGKLSEELG